jgi:DNA-binding transcriptional ArsR family regulator
MTESLDLAFAALSDATRRSILAELSEGERTVNDLVAMHDLSQPAITKHLKVLEAAGLISRGRVGQTRPCALDPEGLKAVAGWVDTYRKHWDDAFDRMDRYLRNLKFSETPND